LRRIGASVDVATSVPPARRDVLYDAVLVSLQPQPHPVISAAEAAAIAAQWPGAVLAQVWGGVDREALASAGVPVWPERAPAAGHMGVLPSAIGPEPVIRLQAGGLKVGELLTGGVRGGPHDCLQMMNVTDVVHA